MFYFDILLIKAFQRSETENLHQNQTNGLTRGVDLSYYLFNTGMKIFEHIFNVSVSWRVHPLLYYSILLFIVTIVVHYCSLPTQPASINKLVDKRRSFLE